MPDGSEKAWRVRVFARALRCLQKNTPSPKTIVVARGVAKNFGPVHALEGCDLEVNAGECLGLLGPNGAGKSTFIGCLYGVVERTGGELTVFGLDPLKAPYAIKSRIGVVPQENA